MSRTGSSARLNEESEVHTPNHSLKKKLSIANAIVTTLFLLAIFILIIIWLWEEFTMEDMYLVESFLDNPKFRQARSVLMTAHGVTFFLLCILQFCMEVESTGQESHTRAKKIVWSLTAALIILSDIAAATIALVFKGNDLGKLQVTMKAEIQLEFMNTSDVFSDVGKTFNSLQSGLQCCGVENSGDYTNTLFANRTGLPFPYSCCVLKSGKTGSVIWHDNVVDWSQCQQESSDYFHSDGCYGELNNLVSDMCTEVGIIGFTMSAILFLICCARLLTEFHFERQNEAYVAYLTRKHVSLKVNKIESKNEAMCTTNQVSKNGVICATNHVAVVTIDDNQNGKMTVDDVEGKARTSDHQC